MSRFEIRENNYFGTYVLHSEKQAIVTLDKKDMLDLFDLLFRKINDVKLYCTESGADGVEYRIHTRVSRDNAQEFSLSTNEGPDLFWLYDWQWDTINAVIETAKYGTSLLFGGTANPNEFFQVAVKKHELVIQKLHGSENVARIAIPIGIYAQLFRQVRGEQ